MIFDRMFAGILQFTPPRRYSPGSTFRDLVLKALHMSGSDVAPRRIKFNCTIAHTVNNTVFELYVIGKTAEEADGQPPSAWVLTRGC